MRPVMRPLFVGGTGRSGTTVTSALLGRHSTLHRIKFETRFVSAERGLCDLVEGRTSLADFEHRLLGEWFERIPKTGTKPKGLHLVMSESTVRAALPILRDGLAIDPLQAARMFTHRLLDPLAVENGVEAWIEMTPDNAAAAASLYRIFPDMKIVISLRDGRDVACSVVRMPWGPSDLDDALDWWATRMEASFVACESLPADRVLMLRMEDLVLHDREAQYARLLAFLGVEDDPTMRTFFDTRMTADMAHAGRWREDVPAARLPEFEGHYERLAAGLAERGRPYRA
jgi:hypothetical protein